MTIFILGGGPAGLALAQGLHEQSQNFVLIEQSGDVGGLAKTIKWNKVGDHDLGPHKIFSTNENLNMRVRNLIASSQWIRREKKAAIFIGGQYLDYPPSPFSLLHIYGIGEFCKMTAGFAFAKMFGWSRILLAKSFEQDLRARVGYPLYNKLFRPIAEKLWGDPKYLDAKLSRGRVQIPSILELVSRLLGLKAASQFEALEFDYPKGGLKTIWNNILQNITESGEVLTGHMVESLTCNAKGKVTSIKIREKKSNKLKVFNLSDEDFVISTLPLSLNATFLSSHLTDGAKTIARNVVKLNDLILVFLHIEDDELTENSWIFVPDANIIFHRLSEQNSFDRSMVISGSIVCCEIMSSSQRDFSATKDQDLIEYCINDLETIGLKPSKICSSKVTRLPKSYPVYEVGFEKKLNSLIDEFDALPNFKTIGRQGSFNYIGTLDAMDIGFGAAEWLCNQNKNWRTERERTEHFPVLD